MKRTNLPNIILTVCLLVLLSVTAARADTVAPAPGSIQQVDLNFNTYVVVDESIIDGLNNGTLIISRDSMPHDTQQGNFTDIFGNQFYIYVVI